MAKVGIESFLLDCHTNDNMAEIEAAYGIKGFAVIVKLWQKIYSDKGYYCEWIERSPLLFLSQWFGGNSGVDLNLINQVVNYAIKIGIFNESMFNEYAILTSERIQRQYFDVVKRRTEIEVIDEYLLVSVANFKGNVNIIEKNVCRNEKNVCRNSTSKVKESKVNKSKVNKSKVNTYFDSEKVNDAFAAYLAMRERSAPVPGSKIVNLIEQLNTFKDKGCSDDELVEIVKEATSKGWMNFYKSDKKKPEQSKANFTERNYSKDDMESLERKLLMRR
ncbi:DUF4373 domain-containing protein [Eubacterium sp. LMAG:50]|uniref:DUF4373 domain-containing protein n=1 Tax=Eubacterium sp. LMAG:50 TaxID=1969563 RepID=UPI0025C5FFA7|nr:DUF4373 domain-containing protein [Eubacterium sp. LMAG:50]